MTVYSAPLEDMRFALRDIVGFDRIAALPGFSGSDDEIMEHVLEEAGKLARDVLAPLNPVGDREQAKLENGVVRPAPGYSEAYGQFWQGGWNAMPFEEELGGQNLPMTLTTAVWEMWNASNLAFALCPLLTQAGIEALSKHASEEQKAKYLPKLVSGEWTGTMNLTEPQSGTDLGAIRTRSERHGDHYRLKGQKIFITWGDHDMTENIVHMVLARSPDGPPGSKGLSLFIVPKYLVNDDGSLGARNDVRPVSLEHKLGIHASPTCVMSYGDNEGAVAYLVGEENRGIEYMFVMMNNARLGVGLQGLAIADRAYQQAAAFARERVQSRPVQGADGPVPIIHHPDVRRMLLGMKSQVEGMRALCYYTAAEIDRANRESDPDAAAKAQRRVDLLIPVVKSWCTDTALAVTSCNIQVHGGMGFIEETGAAQHYRDARITTIYEGTNGVQAMDLIGRKVARDGGEAARELFADIRADLEPLRDSDELAARALVKHLDSALAAAEDGVSWLVATFPKDAATAASAGVPFQNLMGLLCAGWLLARGVAAGAAQKPNANGDAGFLDAKLTTARFFADYHLSQAPSLVTQMTEAGDAVMAMALDRF
ncbi:acyl-CoA dehydrogenase [Nisaea acidiphila]|uniref:3-methylmercaptopropionyl-CoA dehydrogenase n=1 Tax=Nisaea acidiphila TaxID=1862145 RepID=A0A9J7ASV7_9PROT|nr:acyl-CoA dehydrogenase [Nisaea acidiphila]UUX49577.1 acyl-CoA dehydrogenase [Nisaea acidiphila]